MSLVSLHDVSVARGGVTLLEGLTLDIAEGDILWVRGANGTGKSTLLRLLADFLPSASGNVTRHLADTDIAYLGHSDGLDDRARLSSIAALWSLNPQDVRGVTGVTDLARRRVHQLSAGQRRKIDILRLLAAKRPLWLLDEPFASLDQSARDTLTAIVTRHVEMGGAAVIVSHGTLPDFARPLRILDFQGTA